MVYPKRDEKSLKTGFKRVRKRWALSHEVGAGGPGTAGEIKSGLLKPHNGHTAHKNRLQANQ